MLSLTDICKNFSLFLSWTFTVLTSFVRTKQALLHILFWPCRKNPHILFVWNCWKSLMVSCLYECILASYTFTVSLLQFQTWVIRMFLLSTVCRLACYKFTNVIFWVNNLQAYNSNDFDQLFLTAVYDYLQRVTLNRIRSFTYSLFLSCSLSCNNTTADSKINIFPCQQRSLFPHAFSSRVHTTCFPFYIGFYLCNLLCHHPRVLKFLFSGTRRTVITLPFKHELSPFIVKQDYTVGFWKWY